MAKVIPIGDPINDAERAAIAYLRDHLPDNFILLHNFEIVRQRERFEIDLALLTPHALYLIDVKGTRGTIEVYGNRWYPEGRAAYPSPLPKLRSHAKTVKGLITEAHPGRGELDGIYVDVAILLTAPDAFLNDRDQRDADQVVKLKDAQRWFKDGTRIPARFSRNILPQQALILHALQVVKPAPGVPRFGHWQVKERLGATDAYTEYRAENLFAGGTARLRVYAAEPYQPEDARKAQIALIANGYRALSRLPLHPNIVAARDFFPTEDDRAWCLVLDDTPGQALTLHLARPQLALTLDQKWRVARDLLAALAHAHQHGVLHRNLTPGAILLGQDGTTRLTDFDFAKTAVDRGLTIAPAIVDLVEAGYVAPEAYRAPEAATAASDLFSAGAVLYELFTGEKPFSGDPNVVWDREGAFLYAPSELRPELGQAFDAWLEPLCRFDAGARPGAVAALAGLNALLQPAPQVPAVPRPEVPAAAGAEDETDYLNLPAGHRLTHKFVVERRLGRGNFGVVYKVIDTLGDVARAVKLVLNDRYSTLDRLKKEYQPLVQIPEHPRIVRVLDADLIPGPGIPYLVFEYTEGSDVGDMIAQRLLSAEDALELARQVIEGLVHLHGNGFHHCDIKPRNLLWTTKGAKIIDFNVSVRADDREARAGGSRRYLPPDFDPEAVPHNGERADRDLYALGLTLYEALASRYPWDVSEPPPNRPAPDPREFSGCADLAPELVDLVLKAIAPRRAERFGTAGEFRDALAAIRQARRARAPSLAILAPGLGSGGAAPTSASPNSNPFVSHLLSLYSQSRRSNAGTRGLDALGFSAYVETALDRELLPAVLAGEFRLVLISGNAGDGKTAFLQRLEQEVQARGGGVDQRLANGSRLSLAGRRYLINYDGSQDEGTKDNNQVLREFLAPFAGRDAGAWEAPETRLIAINEGRLVDFLTTFADEFPALTAQVQGAFATGQTGSGVAVVNLNLRSVVAPAADGSILERTLSDMTAGGNWGACEGCDLKASCYALHNARSFQDAVAGPRLTERLKTLYTMAHLRGRLHITMRDLRSALSFMLIGNRDCAQIHALYAAGLHEEIARGYYFNSWMGGGQTTADRLIGQLCELDVGSQEDPRFDRGLDFVQPDDCALFRFEGRGQFDFEVLQRLFAELPRGVAECSLRKRANRHRDYLAMARRRQFFERRDNAWERMLPYRSAKRMVEIVQGEEAPAVLTTELLHAINRGEGLQRPERLGNCLALQLRPVESGTHGGTIRSYRLFPLEGFSLAVQAIVDRARFVEHLPSGLILRFQGQGQGALASELIINLDVFEMLMRLNAGYRPSVEELQGFYLCLGVFKNSLNAQPYREMLLTTTGHDFYRLVRQDDGRVELSLLPGIAARETVAVAVAGGQ